MNFQRTIGPLGLLFAGISSVIGSGWLFGPLFAAQIAGPAAVISWVLGGLLMMVIALTFAELSSAFPVAGGMIQFAQQSHGPLMSFMIGWMVWISSVAVAPVETMGLLQYSANYLPGLMITVQHTHVLTYLGIVAAAAIMMVMCVLNFYGARFFSRSNSIIAAIKLIVPLSTVVILIGRQFHPANFTASPQGFLPYGWHGIVAALPLGGVIYSFIGSNTVMQLAGETKNPQRSIPLALMGSMIFCTILYALLQIAFIGAISPSAFAEGWNKLHYAGDSGPFTGIVAAMGLIWFVIIIYADALISPFGTGFVFTASTARVAYGLSEIGFLPAGLKKLTPHGVPLRALLLNYAIGLLLFLPFPGWQKLVGFVISCFIVSYIVGPISLVALRKTQPDVHRPFHLPYAQTIALLAFYICSLLIFWTGWETVLRMMIALSIGLLFYAFYSYREKNTLWIKHWQTSWWIVPYFTALTLISYLGTFGGGLNLIPFGLDFIVIGILTISVFYFAVKS
ncbi:MAG: amino acid permease [Gammaproteobacteria bacterium]|nr:MAG: amino acid permease [Gammaproteobacteria bacterium]